MPDLPAFGRRSESRQALAAPPGGPVVRPSTIASAQAPDYAAAASRSLGRASGQWRLVGDLLAFAGVLIAFLVTLFWPDNPADLAQLDGAIFIPGDLASDLGLDAPAFANVRHFVETVALDTKNSVVPAVTLLGFVAVLRSRWLLAALVAGFFLFPWSLLGYRLTMAPVILCTLIFLALFRIYRPSGRMLIGLIVVAVVAGPFIFSVAGALFNSALGGAGAPKIVYKRVAFANLDALQTSAGEQPGSGRAAVQTPSLLPVMARSPHPGAPYVAAQEAALRGDAATARTMTTRLRDNGFVPNRFDQMRVDEIEQYAVAAGQDGQQAAQALNSTYRNKAAIAWVIYVIGLAFALAGPFVDLLANAIERRSVRLGEAIERLRRGRTASAVQLKAQTSSIAASDGQAIIAAMSRRIVWYRIAAGAALGLAAVSVGAAWLYWLPPADANTAFDQVGIVAGARAFAESSGLAGQPHFSLADAVWSMMFPFGFIVVAILAAAIFRQAVRPLLAGVALVILAAQIQPQMPTGRAWQEVAAADFTPQIRAYLHQQAVSGETPELPARRHQDVVSHLRPSVTLPSFSVIAPKEPAVAARPSAASKSTYAAVDSSAAAYTLTQLAYLENKPKDAASMARLIRIPETIAADVHRQRLMIILDWLEAHGEATAKSFVPQDLADGMGATRRFGRTLLLAAVILTCLALVPICLAAYAGRRRSRIGELVRQAHQVAALTAR